MTNAYDHWRKAGNQGDVVKHVALIAALDIVLDTHERKEFLYADTYAGYAQIPLLKSNQRETFEWIYGIGKLQPRIDSLRGNRHVELWCDWYLQGRPVLLNGMYPGSSLIAWDMCGYKGKTARMSLWDLSPKVIENLMTIYGNEHSIFPRPAAPGEEDAVNADFLLIDPPDIKWDEILGFLGRLQKDKPFLVWLAVGADEIGDPANAAKEPSAKKIREDALRLGYSVTKVQWPPNGNTIGCQLIYRLDVNAKPALREAVSYVVDASGWQGKLKSAKAVVHYP
ncbi:MAG: hypothetical protein WCX65_03070 [bacterium]